MGDGEAHLTISGEIGRLQHEYYGQAASRARTHISDDLVVVVLEGTFTPGERTLIEHGAAEPVQTMRRTFQQVMGEQFSSVVEQATGRRVRAFLSATDAATDVSVEIFLLSDERTDMSGFESGQETEQRLEPPR